MTGAIHDMTGNMVPDLKTLVGQPIIFLSHVKPSDLIFCSSALTSPLNRRALKCSSFVESVHEFLREHHNHVILQASNVVTGTMDLDASWVQ